MVYHIVTVTNPLLKRNMGAHLFQFLILLLLLWWGLWFYFIVRKDASNNVSRFINPRVALFVSCSNIDSAVVGYDGQVSVDTSFLKAFTGFLVVLCVPIVFVSAPRLRVGSL